MKSTINLRLAFMVAIALALAVTHALGITLFSNAELSSLALIPFAMSGELDMGDIAQMIKQQGTDLDAWKKQQETAIKQVNDDLVEIAKKGNRPNLGNQAAPGEKSEKWFDPKTRSPVLVLNHGQRVSQSKDAPSMGRLLRGIVMGGRADDANDLTDERKAMGISNDPSGGFTVGGTMASEWIDLMRAQMVLSQAGCRTVPMNTGTLSLARLTSDPVVTWHGENAAITAAEPTFGQVNLNAKTVVCLVKMSLELSQDSANIEQILQSTIVNAMAGAIDSAGLVGVTANEGAAPSGVVNLSGRKKVTGIGAPANWDFAVDGMYELMLQNVPIDSIGALVAHPALWKTMSKLKVCPGTDNMPLSAPAEVMQMRKLWTTAAPLASGTTATGIIADWRDLLFGVRQDITVKVLQETFLGSNLQIAVLAYARVDFAATRHQSFCTLEGITV